jgi:multidrug resistance protein MdtO
VLGLGSVALLLPEMNRITPLVVLVGAVSFAFAWCSGGRQFGFLGLQLAFSFYSVALNDYRPPTELAPARDNFIGIALATVVMWVVFDAMWPVTTNMLMCRILASILRRAACLLELMDAPLDQATKTIRARVLRYRLGTAASALGSTSELTEYEFGAHRARELELSNRIVGVAAAASALFWRQLAVLYGEREPAAPPAPDVVRARQEMAMALTAYASALERREGDSAKIRGYGVTPPSEEGAHRDQDMGHTISAFERIRGGVLGVLRSVGGSKADAVTGPIV